MRLLFNRRSINTKPARLPTIPGHPHRAAVVVLGLMILLVPVPLGPVDNRFVVILGI